MRNTFHEWTKSRKGEMLARPVRWYSDQLSQLLKLGRRLLVAMVIVLVVLVNITVYSGIKRLNIGQTETLPIQNNISKEHPIPLSPDQQLEALSSKEKLWRRKAKFVQRGSANVYNQGGQPFQNISLSIPSNGEAISYAKIVVIIAYMRTGSTLVGKLIEQHPGTFYLFEPIRSIKETLQNLSESGRILTYLDGKKRKYRVSDTINVFLHEIINWMTCRLELQSIESLSDRFHKLFTSKMRTFYYCSNVHFQNISSARASTMPYRELRSYALRKSRIYSCLRQAVHACQNASLISLKFIRLRMRNIEPLLPLFPNMKIIHLNRDPRGIFNSRMKLHSYKNNLFDSQVMQHCQAISDDLSVSKSLLLGYPGRLKIINYDSLAENPMLVSKEIYDFIGVDFTNSVKKFVERMTSSSKDSCKFCTERKNSSATASRWRHDMSKMHAFDKVKVIQEMCQDSNRVLGYRPLNSVADLSNPDVSSRQHVNVTKALLDDSVI